MNASTPSSTLIMHYTKQWTTRIRNTCIRTYSTYSSNYTIKFRSEHRKRCKLPDHDRKSFLATSRDIRQSRSRSSFSNLYSVTHSHGLGVVYTEEKTASELEITIRFFF